MKSLGSFLSALMLFFIPSVAAGQIWNRNARVNDVPGLSGLYLSSIAVDADGNAYAVWEDNRNGNDDIYFSIRPPGGDWGSNVQVNDDTGTYDQASPFVAVTAGGNAYAVWKDNRNGDDDIFFAFRPAGGNWGANVQVNDDSSTYSQKSPCIAIDPNGNAYAIWVDDRNSLGGPNSDIYFAYRPAGGSWGANVKVNDDAGLGAQGYPSIAVDSNGNAYALWYDLRNTLGGEHYDIYFAYRPTNGNWQTNVKVNDDVGDHYKAYTSIAVDADGNAYAVWNDLRDGYYDVYFAYRPKGGNWGANSRVTDTPPFTGAVYPSIGVDPDGNAYAIWHDWRNENYDIYSAYRPVGGSWMANVRVNHDLGTAIQDFPRMAVGIDGTAYAVWRDARSDYFGDDIYFSCTEPTRPSVPLILFLD